MLILTIVFLLATAGPNVRAETNNPPEKPPTAAVQQSHPTSSTGVPKLSRRERKERLRNLADRYHEFLRDVEPIMLPEELSTFLVLESDAQRDLYIEKFWEVRDSDPATPRNEYREMYGELVQEAKKKFRYLTSDRSRVYLTRGRPAEIIAIDNCEDYLQPIQIWIYHQPVPQGAGEARLIFYVPRTGIDYRLWVPIAGMISESIKDLLSVQGERAGLGGPRGGMRMSCYNFDALTKAIAWTEVNRFDVIKVFEPPEVETEDVGRILRSAVIRNPDAPELNVDLTTEYPG
ncbi:MAG TPA: GWxTD domain-containing protein, partial [Thermoanaerobaculia bacterium]|nr:GWxTD domain-containing protein [Thermoanaerobaculia bacterium]